MREYTFLYRLKDSDDRDACAYIKSEPIRFECGHYFSHINLHGSCYCGGQFAEYEDIETILTKDEYDLLLKTNQEIDLLKYGIKEGDERYLRGLELIRQIKPIVDKLQSQKALEFYEDIAQDEMSILSNEHGLNEEDIEEIFDNYGLDYRDRSVVFRVFNDLEDLGREMADCYGIFSTVDTVSRVFEQCIDYEKFGGILIRDSDGQYVELVDGRVVELSY